MKSKTIILIAGPTAVGKTSLAIELAQYLNTSIISADSRQCYRELNIGVAKPSGDQLKQVKHYFINSHSIHQEVNAALFENYALKAAGDIFATNQFAVMVGGTGLYIKAFCEGLDEIPTISTEIRSGIAKNYKENGISWLQDQINKHDPEYSSTGETLNPQRMMRALEVVLGTGKSIRRFQQKRVVMRDFNILKIGLELPRKQLYEQIDRRVDSMMRAGLLAEVSSLYLFKSLPALQTVGYNELFAHLDGGLPLDAAIDLIKKNTRHYAKRQLTWFKKDKDISWFQLPQIEDIVARLEVE